MIKFIKQLFCKHDYEMEEQGYTQDFDYVPTKVTNYTCHKCGHKSHVKGW